MMHAFKVDKRGMDFRLKTVADGAPQAAARAIHEGMQGAFRQSQREVPVSPRQKGRTSGTLKNSGQLKDPEMIGDARVEVAITYGGAATAYAEVQHENRTLNHPLGGKGGYVIDPVRAAVPDMQRRLELALKRLGTASS
jgi:hypothetical protein